MGNLFECLTGEPKLQQKTVTPSNSVQTVTPDSGYDGLYEVIVNAQNLVSGVGNVKNIRIFYGAEENKTNYVCGFKPNLVMAINMASGEHRSCECYYEVNGTTVLNEGWSRVRGSEIFSPSITITNNGFSRRFASHGSGMPDGGPNSLIVALKIE